MKFSIISPIFLRALASPLWYHQTPGKCFLLLSLHLPQDLWLECLCQQIRSGKSSWQVEISDDDGNELTVMLVAIYSSEQSTTTLLRVAWTGRKSWSLLCLAKHVMIWDEVPTWDTGGGQVGSWRSLKFSPVTLFLCYLLLCGIPKSGQAECVSEILAGLRGLGRGKDKASSTPAGVRARGDISKRELSSSFYLPSHQRWAVPSPPPFGPGENRRSRSWGDIVFPLNPISRAIKYSKTPKSLSSRQRETLTFSFPTAGSFEKELQVTIPMDKLIVFSGASPWLDYSLQFVSKLIQNLPL